MSSTSVLLERTGPAVAEEAPQVPTVDDGSGRPSRYVDSKSQFRLTNAPSASERWFLLGSLMAQLRYVPFTDIEVLLGVHDSELVMMLHGERPITRKYAERWERVQEMLTQLATVLRPEGTSKWLHVGVPDLNGATPIDAISRGKLRLVLDVTSSYLDPSYK
jgi:hypothetical protein